MGRKYNNNYAYKYGDWCQLCISFWTGIIICLLFVLLGIINYSDALIYIFATPSLVVLLFNKTTE